MKKQIITLLLMLSVTVTALCQNVGIGTTTPNSSAALDVTSDSKGILIPRMDSAKRVAIASPAEGLMVYQKNGTKGFYYYNGSAWSFVGNAAGPAIPTPTGNQGKLLSSDGTALTWIEPANQPEAKVVLSGGKIEASFDFSSFKNQTNFVVDLLIPWSNVNIKLPDASSFSVGTIVTIAILNPKGTAGTANLWIPGCKAIHLMGGGKASVDIGYAGTGQVLYQSFLTNGQFWYELNNR